jgi:hypothetical protein
VHAIPTTGIKLWKQNVGSDARTKLKIAELKLAKGEYLTAIRFEYGAVLKGFTSSNSERANLNGEHDNLLKAGSGAILKTSAAAKSEEPVLTASAKAKVNPDWTPVQGDVFYVAEAAAATGLKGASYMVTAKRAMQDEDIVSSASAGIAKGAVKDLDQDAVVTKEIATFSLNPDDKEADIKSAISSDSFTNKLDNNGVQVKGGKLYSKNGDQLATQKTDSKGRLIGPDGTPVTGDEIRLVLLIGLMVISLACMIFVSWSVVTTPRRRTSSTKGGAK